MSAPYIIPFNFQPVSTVSSSSGTYTVPSGKYARVVISNAGLPILNSVNLYITKTLITINIAYTVSPATSHLPIMQTSGIHRLNLVRSNTANNLYISLNPSSMASSNNYTQTIGNGVSSMSVYFPSGSSLYDVTVCGDSTGNITTCTADCYYGSSELWLKGGDVFTYTTGSIVYTEYNSIS